jgi:hypothetical protein
VDKVDRADGTARLAMSTRTRMRRVIGNIFGCGGLSHAFTMCRRGRGAHSPDPQSPFSSPSALLPEDATEAVLW